MRLRLGTRGSRLALVQARVVADLIRSKCPGIGVELVILKTSGDVRSEFGDEISNTVGEFSSELEKALISNDIDAAVHSAKDLPTKMPDSLMVGAYPERADPRDAWVSQVEPMSKKGEGRWVGTESPRRRLFWAERDPLAQFKNIRGNVDRRMERCASDEDWKGVILACAGIDRLGGVPVGLKMERLEVKSMIPAPGQGAIAVQCRKEDKQVIQALSKIDDKEVRCCVTAERSFLQSFGGGCSESLGAFAQIQPNQTLLIQAGVKSASGGVYRAKLEGPCSEEDLLGRKLAEVMHRG